VKDMDGVVGEANIEICEWILVFYGWPIKVGCHTVWDINRNSLYLGSLSKLIP